MDKIILILISILMGIIINNYILNLPRGIKEIGKIFKWKFSKVTPIIILLNIALYVGLYMIYGVSIELFRYAMLSSLLIAVIFIDSKLYIIPNGLNLFGLIYGVVCILCNLTNYKTMIFGALFGFVFFFLIIFLSEAILKKQGMGEGDLKLMTVMGLYLGLAYTVLTTFLSFILGAVISILLLVFKIKKVDEQIPFGPFIAISGIITMFCGNNIIYWYLGM